MDLHLSLHGLADLDLERATMSDSPEDVRKLNFTIERATMAFESWVLASGGSMVSEQGTRVQAILPADRLDELPEKLEQYEEMTQARVCVGVGMEQSEAATALKVAEARPGNPSVILYNEDVAAEAHELEEESKSGELSGAEQDSLEDNGNAPQSDGGVEPTVRKAEGFGQAAQAGEATKVANGSMDPMHAMPSAPSAVSPVSAMSPPSSADQGGGASPAPGQPAGPDQLKQAVVAVLQDVKQNMQAIEQLKQASPGAYQSIMGLVQAFIAVAEQKFPAQPGQDQGAPPPGMQKSEGCPKCGGKLVQQCQGKGEDHMACPKCDGSALAKGAVPEQGQPPAAHHHLNLPVGSQHDGQVKVRTLDGTSQWRSVRAGQVVAQDGMAISSRSVNAPKGAPNLQQAQQGQV